MFQEVHVNVDPEKLQVIAEQFAERDATIEGLGQENTELGTKLDALIQASKQAVSDLVSLTDVPLSELEDSIKVIQEQLDFAVDSASN
jgi:hypothetical protein